MSVNVTLESIREAQTEGAGLENSLPPYQNQPYQNGLTLGDWLALLHQTPPSAASHPSKMTREDLRRENIYEDRA